jgi:NADH-ubiquinone oxidoreductase chain 4
MAQLMPLFGILFFILCLANCGSPLTLNFVGEFMSLYGVFERFSLFGVLASSSIVFSAAYTILMYQKIALGGSYSRMFTKNLSDLTKREYSILLTLVIPTVVFGIYTGPILDGLHYAVSTLIFNYDSNVISCDAPRA